MSELPAIPPDAFRAALPPHAQPYADAMLAAAQPGVGPFVLYGLGTNETRWGTSPAYRGGTGDHGSRWLLHPYPFAASSGLLTGQTRAHAQGDGSLTQEVRPPAIACPSCPEPARGWGYGLLQIDAASFWDWLHANDWADPKLNVAKGASILAAKIAYIRTHAPKMLAPLELLHAGCAAYNHGENAVCRNLAHGLDPDYGTISDPPNAYGINAMAHAKELIAAYATHVGQSVDEDALLLWGLPQSVPGASGV